MTLHTPPSRPIRIHTLELPVRRWQARNLGLTVAITKNIYTAEVEWPL